MAKIIHKKSSIPSKVPTASDLEYGELALNYKDGKLYFKNATNDIQSFNSDTSSFVTLTGAQTLTNKTLTSPTITGGTLDNVIIGGNTPTAITGTDVSATSTLKSLNSVGDEGGEILLAKAQTNTTLSGSVTIDIYQNKLRVFETGGANRGVYIDLTSANSAVGTDLLGGAVGVTSVDGNTGTVTAAQLLTAIKKEDGAGSGLDADLLDGLNTSSTNAVSTVMTRDANGQTGIGAINFDGSAAVTLAAGRLWYDGVTGSWQAGMGNGNITQNIGEEFFKYGKASSAISDINLQLVYKTGVVGASGVITFAPTIAGITDPDQIIGIATESIALNGFGRVTTSGVVHGINTTGSAYGEVWANNDDIWYNPVTGGLTKTKPSAPNIKLMVGTVINAGPGGSGSFDVKFGSSSALGGTDSNVELSALSGGDLLVYNVTNSRWENATQASITSGDSDKLDGQHGSYYLDWTNVTNKPDPVITLAGDLSGSVTLTDLASGTLTATIAANSVALGTDTTGNYLATLASSGNTIAVSGSGSESATVNIDLPNSGVTAGSYGSSTAIPVISVDAQGRITTASTSSITVGDGALTLATSGIGLSGSASFSANQSTGSTFTVTSNATSSNTASTIVARDASGNFTAGTITATLSGNASTVTNGVYTTGSYADPAWITSLAKSKVGLGNVENTALSTWAGSTNITTIGAATASSLTVTGDLTVNGSVTTINSTTISVDDKNIELGSVATPTNTTADGGGITLKGATDKTFNWINSTGAWTSSEHLALAAGKDIILNGLTSGSVTLVVPDAAGTTTITLPATTGTVITTGDSGTVTNTMLAGSIANSKLANSSITVNGTAISLGGSGTITATATNALTIGSYLTGTSYNGSSAVTIAVDATNLNTASKVVARDASGNFSAGTITAALSGNATTATTLATSRNINGVAFNGSADITITAANPNALTIGTGLSGTSYNGSAAVTIALATGYGDTQNPYASKTANYFLAAPNGTAGAPTFRAIVAADIPTLNQNTTGTASNITAYTINQNLGTSNSPSFDQVLSTNNGNGTNFKVGDDAWIGDINTANTIRITGLQDATAGYIVFGNSNATALGRTGTGSLTYGGNALITTGDTGTVTNTMLAGSIANAKLANSSVTVGTTAIALGASSTTLAGLTSVTSTSFVGALTGNASTATTATNQSGGTVAATTGSFSGQITSTVADGTAPMVVTSTTKVANLNVERVDGYHADETNTASSLVARNASKNIAVSGVVLSGSTSGTSTLVASAAAGTTTHVLPSVSGTIITNGDTGSVTSTMILDGTIVNADINASAAIAVSKLAASTISGVTLGNNLNTLTLNVSGTGLSGSTTYNGSAAATFTVTSNATNANTASTIVARDASGNFSAGTITANAIQHSGLTMTVGTNVDQIYSVTDTLTLTTSWQDTSVNAAELATGSYMVQVAAVNDFAVGGGHYNEYYTGVMSWVSVDTNSSASDEIVLHRAGHAPNSGTIFLRTLRTASADAADLKLQIAGTTTNTGTSTYTFKFRRLI